MPILAETNESDPSKTKHLQSMNQCLLITVITAKLATTIKL